MTVFAAIRKRKDSIVAGWLEQTLDSYLSPAHFKQSRDRFANPVGTNIRESLERLFDLCAGDETPENFTLPLDQLLRIRAVQDFTAAQAVAPVLELKWAVRRQLTADGNPDNLLARLDDFDLRVDKAALAAFEVYVACRERLYQVRLDEYKSGRHLLTGAACPSAMLRRQRDGGSGNTLGDRFNGADH